MGGSCALPKPPHLPFPHSFTVLPCKYLLTSGIGGAWGVPLYAPFTPPYALPDGRGGWGRGHPQSPSQDLEFGGSLSPSLTPPLSPQCREGAALRRGPPGPAPPARNLRGPLRPPDTGAADAALGPPQMETPPTPLAQGWGDLGNPPGTGGAGSPQIPPGHHRQEGPQCPQKWGCRDSPKGPREPRGCGDLPNLSRERDGCRDHPPQPPQNGAGTPQTSQGPPNPHWH